MVIQRVVTRSPTSVTWSLCRWVSRTASSRLGPDPAAASRITTPRPASTRKDLLPARTSVAGPARCGSGRGCRCRAGRPRSWLLRLAHGLRPGVGSGVGQGVGERCPGRGRGRIPGPGPGRSASAASSSARRARLLPATALRRLTQKRTDWIAMSTASRTTTAGKKRSRNRFTPSMWLPAGIPTVTQTPTQMAAPIMLAARNRGHFIGVMPATRPFRRRSSGRNRPATTTLLPCRS